MKDDIFVVGEVAVFQNLPFPFNSLNGQDAKILGPMRFMHVVDLHGTSAVKLAYAVEADNHMAACEPAFLKKKPKKAVESREQELAEV